jgi:DNA processing protein
MIRPSAPILMMRIDKLAPVHPGEVYVQGALPECVHAIAIVGARAARRASMERAHRLARELAERGLVIVSGGAIGVDAAAHRGALAAERGQTIAVLGSGLEELYPVRNLSLFDAIVVSGRGALMSPFLPCEQPLRWHFPKRNRLIAALADAVLVVEAAARSGALGTAAEARALGKRVLAIPGSPGCDGLLAAGAYAVETTDEVLAALAGKRRERIAPDGELGRVLGALDNTSAYTVDDVAKRSQLPIMAVHAALLRLTLMGYVARLPGERYKRLEMVA